jgi:hypothetical protein
MFVQVTAFSMLHQMHWTPQQHSTSVTRKHAQAQESVLQQQLTRLLRRHHIL